MTARLLLLSLATLAPCSPSQNVPGKGQPERAGVQIVPGEWIFGELLESKLDNPIVGFDGFHLDSVPTKWNGTMPQEITSDASGPRFVNYNSDFLQAFSKGEADVASYHAASVGSVNSKHALWPGATGIYTAKGAGPLSMYARGVRLGYLAMDVDRVTVLPDGTNTYGAHSTISLDPDVALVPVQVAAVFSDEYPMPDNSLDDQLTLWDAIPKQIEWINVTSGQTGETTETRHVFSTDLTLDYATLPPHSGKYQMHRGQITPDTAFVHCGVQFRLVNFLRVKGLTRNVYPIRHESDETTNDAYPRSTFDDRPCRDAAELARASPDYLKGLPLVILMGEAAFRDAKEKGRSLVGEDTSCVSYDARLDTLLVHEIAHMSGLMDCELNPDCRLMQSAGAGVLRPSDSECKVIQRWAREHSKFFKRP